MLLNPEFPSPEADVLGKCSNETGDLSILYPRDGPRTRYRVVGRRYLYLVFRRQIATFYGLIFDAT